MSHLSQTLRLLIDAPLSGAMNMAIDDVLLNSGIHGVASLRFYQWAEPTISVGHFQAAQGQLVPERFQALNAVKRLSGGGAILHHHELTYSCVIPTWHPITKEPLHIYDLVHQSLINVLKKQGVEAAMRGDAAFADQSFLCFSRGDSRDLVIGSHKIVGSAQRRRQGVILQHGSLLLRQSEHASEFPGIFELTGRTIAPMQILPDLTAEIVTRLGVAVKQGILTPEEKQSAERLQSKQSLKNEP